MREGRLARSRIEVPLDETGSVVWRIKASGGCGKRDVGSKQKKKLEGRERIGVRQGAGTRLQEERIE